MSYFDSSTVNLTDEQIKYRHYDEDGNEYFEVDKILDKKYDSRERKHKYKVMWKGWPNEEDQTWEPYENLEHVRDVVDEFEKQWKEKSKKKGGRGARALHTGKPEEKSQPEPEEKKYEPEQQEEEEEIDIHIHEDKKVTPVKDPEPEPEPTPTSTPTKKGSATKKGKTKASKVNNAQPASNILKDRASEQKNGSAENEPPLGEAYSVPIKKKAKMVEEEDTVDPRIKRKEPTTNMTPPKTDIRDNILSGSTLGKQDLSFKPTNSEEIPIFQKSTSQEKMSRFSDSPPATNAGNVNGKVGQAPAPIDKRSTGMVIEEPPKRGGAMEISAPKMSLLESIVNREQEHVVVGQKPEPPGAKSNPPEKELPALNRNKSIPDEGKYRPAPPPVNYNPYSPPSTVSLSAMPSAFGQLFKTQNEMAVEDVRPPGKVDRTKSMIDDIDRMMEDHETEEVSLSKMDSVKSGRSDVMPPQGIQRNKSEQYDPKKVQMQKKPSEIVIDDDDVEDTGRKDNHHYGKKKERGHSRSRSRSPGHNKKKSKWNDSPEAKDKGKFRDSRHHYEDKHGSHHDGGDKYNKNKKEREREKEKEKEKDREREKQKEKEKEKDKDREKERHKRDTHKVDHHNTKKSHEVKHEKHEVMDLLGKNDKFEEMKIQKKRAVYKKTLYAKEQLMLDYDVDDRVYYKSLVNDYMGKKIDREMFMDMLCPEGNFKDDEIQEIKAMSWGGKVTMNPEDYYFKVVWKTNKDGVQKGCRYVSWQEFLEEKPKEAAEFVMNKLMAIVTKYGTFGEL